MIYRLSLSQLFTLALFNIQLFTMKNRKTVFVAGSISPDEKVDELRFNNFAKNLKDQGYSVTFTRQHRKRSHDRNISHKKDIVLMLASNELFLLPNWQSDSYSVKLRDIALNSGITVHAN
jgi:hypothetical protein